MKYYAVRNGRKIGIFTDWNKCKASVDKFPEQEYRSFKVEAEAEAYLRGEVVEQTVPSPTTLSYSYAFVDGSYNDQTKVAGYGGFLIDNHGEKHVFQGSTKEVDAVKMRNVAGEILGAMAAAQLAKQLKMSTLTIFYDYKGIEEWVTGAWKCKKSKTMEYQESMQRVIDSGVAIQFCKVKGHSGILGNEEADKLAKKAVGILENDKNVER